MCCSRFCMFVFGYRISMRLNRDHLVQAHPSILQPKVLFRCRHSAQCASAMWKSTDGSDFFHNPLKNHVYRRSSCRFAAIHSSSSTAKNTNSKLTELPVETDSKVQRLHVPSTIKDPPLCVCQPLGNIRFLRGAKRIFLCTLHHAEFVVVHRIPSALESCPIRQWLPPMRWFVRRSETAAVPCPFGKCSIRGQFW